MAMDSIRLVSYIAVVTNIWDWLRKLKAEYYFLWSRPLNELNAARVLYIFTRYSPFLCHVLTMVLLRYKEQYKPSIPTHICRNWSLLILISVSWTFGLLLANLMLRVYALCELDSRVIYALVFLLIIKIANVLVFYILLPPYSHFSPICIPLVNKPFRVVCFTVIELVVQAVPVYLTLSRAKIERAARVRRVEKLVTSLRREGVFSWTAVTVFCSVLVSIAAQPRNSPSASIHIAHPLFVTFVSILGCHLILQVREPTDDLDPNGTDAPGQVSFELDTCGSIWDTRTFIPELEEPAPNNHTQSSPAPLIDPQSS